MDKKKTKTEKSGTENNKIEEFETSSISEMGNVERRKGI